MSAVVVAGKEGMANTGRNSEHSISLRLAFQKANGEDSDYTIAHDMIRA